MLRQRILTVAVLLPLFLAALFLLPNLYWRVLTCAVLGLAAREWTRFASYAGPGRWAYPALVVASAVAILAAEHAPWGRTRRLSTRCPGNFSTAWPRCSGWQSCPPGCTCADPCATRFCSRDWRPGPAPVLACADLVATDPRPPSGCDGGDLDRRHRRLLRWTGPRPAQARPGDQPGQDLGRGDRGAGCGRVVLERRRVAAPRPLPAVSCGRGAGRGAHRRQHPGRSVRVLDEAARRVEGQRSPAAWAWRGAGSRGRAHLRAAAGGPILRLSLFSSSPDSS